MSTMRQRAQPGDAAGDAAAPAKPAAAAAPNPVDLLVGMGVAGALMALCGLAWLARDSTALLGGGAGAASSGGLRVFTPEELKAEGSGESGGTLMLAILGEVYDVSAGQGFYAPGQGGYNCFVGRDGSRAFVTGEFEGAGLTDDVEGLAPSELEGVLGWRDFYRDEARYPTVGVLSGRYYDVSGARRPGVLDAYEAAVAEWKAAEEATREEFPPCNSKWTQGASHVWCTSKSGGTERGWVGYPRKMHRRGSAVDSAQCVCTKDANTFVSGDNLLEVYSGCEKYADKCDTTE